MLASEAAGKRLSSSRSEKEADWVSEKHLENVRVVLVRDRGDVNPILEHLGALPGKDVLVEEVLQLLVCDVDAELLEGV